LKPPADWTVRGPVGVGEAEDDVDEATLLDDEATDEEAAIEDATLLDKATLEADDAELEAEEAAELESEDALDDTELDTALEADETTELDAEVADEDAALDDDELCGLSWYMFSLPPAPQYSDELPPHKLLQPAPTGSVKPPAIRAEPALIVLPQ